MQRNQSGRNAFAGFSGNALPAQVCQVYHSEIDMAKVKQMLDAGWGLKLFRSGMDSYCVIARHPKMMKMPRIQHMIDEYGDLVTDDFTPEQALTRMAYKVHGEILASRKNK